METKQLVRKISEDRANSFWYYGRRIAVIEYKDKKLCIEARGDVSIQLEKSGEVFTNRRAIEEAVNCGVTDRQLDKIKSFGCLRNNCFAIMEIDSEGNVGETIDVVNTYDEAIKSAEELVLI